MNEFSKIIQELRKSKGMSQEKLAAQFGISVQAVSKHRYLVVKVYSLRRYKGPALSGFNQCHLAV